MPEPEISNITGPPPILEAVEIIKVQCSSQSAQCLHPFSFRPMPFVADFVFEYIMDGTSEGVRLLLDQLDQLEEAIHVAKNRSPSVYIE